MLQRASRAGRFCLARLRTSPKTRRPGQLKRLLDATVRVDRELKDRERFVELAVGSCEQPRHFAAVAITSGRSEIITQPFIRVEDLSRPLDAASGRERLDRVRHEGIDAGFHDAARVEKRAMVRGT